MVKQENVNKFSTPFNPEPLKVVAKTGNSLVIESRSGAQYSRNTSHLKKYTSHVEKANDYDASVTDIGEKPMQPVMQPITPRIIQDVSDVPETSSMSTSTGPSSVTTATQPRLDDSRPQRQHKLKLPSRYSDYQM